MVDEAGVGEKNEKVRNDLVMKQTIFLPWCSTTKMLKKPYFLIEPLLQEGTCQNG